MDQAGENRWIKLVRSDTIERIATDELRVAELLPSSPGAIRIERFVEKRFAISCVRYESLDHGILGYTQFGPKGVEAIIVSRALSEEGSRVAERRINTTLAHEAGHGLLHINLFRIDAFPISIFENSTDVTPTRILCRDVPHAGSVAQREYNGRWWELQANRMIGALLLPVPLVRACLQDLLVPLGSLGANALPDQSRYSAIHLLSEVFDVNPKVAEIRIQLLYPPLAHEQLTL